MNIKAKWPTITGCEYYDTEAKSIVSGKVIFIGRSDKYYTVNIQCNSSECVRYGHLLNTNVKLNDMISEGQVLGQAAKFVFFEYCTVAKGNSKWPVRLYTKTYYKQNPMSLLESNYEVITNLGVDVVKNLGSLITLTPEQKLEFGDNKGDNTVEF